MSTRLTLADRWRRWSYLQDVELWLWDMPGARRRTLLRELRANLADAAADQGMAEAIAELGPARPLARSYLDSEPRSGPRWATGAFAALAALAVGLFGYAIYTIGMLDALGAGGGGRVAVDALGVRVDAVHTADEISAGFTGLSWPWILAIAVSWAVGARLWRLFRRTAT